MLDIKAGYMVGETAKLRRLGLTTRSIPRFEVNLGLGAKMALVVTVGVLSLIALFAYLGTAALSENTQRTLQERVVLAQTTASSIDSVLANIEDVMTSAVSETDLFLPGQMDAALAHAYSRLDFFTSQVILVDRTGRVVGAQPPLPDDLSLAGLTPVDSVLAGQSFAVSRTAQPVGALGSMPIAAVPARDARGALQGALVVEINLTAPSIPAFAHPIGLGETGYMDLVDRQGVILASTLPGRAGHPSDQEQALAGMINDHRQAVSTCPDCDAPSPPAVPQHEVLAFAPLANAQWGVTVRQSEAEVFADTRLLQTRIFGLMAIALVGALLLVFVTTRSIIRPVQELTAATRRMASGDLETPVAAHGNDEIGALARSFDEMRAQLHASMAESLEMNRDLDQRVQERTAALTSAAEENARLYTQLQGKEKLHSELLHRVISAQEEERKRISRELHDDTCQILTGLSYALDNAAETCDSPELQPLLEKMHAMTDGALDEVHRIILDLRPSMLDHLGFIPALRWYAETRLKPLGIRFTLREIGDARRLPPAIETVLFRVVQETINNIARHSEAENASLVFQFADDCVEARISDDGNGFDAAQVMGAPNGGRGLGLMGMEERMSTVAGTFRLRSAPGAGTVIRLHIPLDGNGNGQSG